VSINRAEAAQALAEAIVAYKTRGKDAVRKEPPVIRRRIMKRASYKEAVFWIAHNDNAGSDDSEQEVASYVSTLLVADLFSVEPERVTRDVIRIRDNEI
jgi:hypothetical protein